MHVEDKVLQGALRSVGAGRSSTRRRVGVCAIHRRR